MDVAAWLRDLGHERYVSAFRDNDIDAEVLLKLTAEDLVSIGVTSVGHRRKLLDAIADLGMAVPTAVAAVPARGAPAQVDAERRQLTVMFCDLVYGWFTEGGLDQCLLGDLGAEIAIVGVRSVPTMDSATWCRPPAAASAARRLRPEVWKNSSTALSSNEGELGRSITTGAPAMASFRPSPVRVLTPLLGEAATTSWPPWCRMATVFEPIKPVPPMTTIFMLLPSL
jgi:hypothetical protein